MSSVRHNTDVETKVDIYFIVGKITLWKISWPAFVSKSESAIHVDNARAKRFEVYRPSPRAFREVFPKIRYPSVAQRPSTVPVAIRVNPRRYKITFSGIDAMKTYCVPSISHGLQNMRKKLAKKKLNPSRRVRIGPYDKSA